MRPSGEHSDKDLFIKKLLIGIGLLYTGLILIATIGYLAVKIFGKDLDQESRAYVDQAVPLILTSWNAEELLKRASPELLKKTPPKTIKSLFNEMSRQLGPMKTYNGSEGEAHDSVNPEQGRQTVANYQAKAVFEKAPAKVDIKLILHNHEWKIFSFQVNFKAFL